MAEPVKKTYPHLEKARAARQAKIAAAKQEQAPAAEDPAAYAANFRRPSAREPMREMARENGRTQAIGRGGELLTRKRTQTGDIFDIPAALIPKGWEYQWCAVTVVGNSEILLDQNLMFAENGWRPVPSNRYPGRFMPAGHEGNIIRGGQMLMERPKSLSDEARAEDIRMAKQQISDRNDALKLSGMKKNMGSGFEMGGKYKGTGGSIRMEIDRNLDVAPPSYDLAED